MLGRHRRPNRVRLASRLMTVQRMDHVSIVVDDLAAAIEFFAELGLELQGETQVEGRWVDRIVGLEDVERASRWCRRRTATDDSSW